MDRRVRGDPYYELMDEFLSAVKRRYGNTVLLQFEGMAYENSSKLLNMYRCGSMYRCGPNVLVLTDVQAPALPIILPH